MIRKLFPGHAMHDSGRFLIGDVILAINDQIMDGMTYQEAIAVIRSSPKEVTFIAKRPARNEIPSELFEASRPVSPEKLLKDSKLLSGMFQSNLSILCNLKKIFLNRVYEINFNNKDRILEIIICIYNLYSK